MQIVFILLLLTGLIAGVILVGQRTRFVPKADVGIRESSVSLSGFSSIAPIVSAPVNSSQVTSVITVKPQDLFRVDVLIRSTEAEINLAVAKLNFDKNFLQVDDVRGITMGKQPPFLPNQIEVENIYDNSAGNIHISGGIADPGYKSSPGQSAVLASIFFKAIKEGTTNISLLSGTALFKNLDNQEIAQVIKRDLEVRISKRAVLSPPPTVAISAPVSVISPTLVLRPTSTLAPTVRATPTTRVRRPCALTPMPGFNPKTGECKDFPTSCVDPGWNPLAFYYSCADRGDINDDGKFSYTDLSMFMSKFGKSARLGGADLNGDGVVNAVDFKIIRETLIKKGVLKGSVASVTPQPAQYATPAITTR